MTKTSDEKQDTVLIVDDTAPNHDIIGTFLRDINVNCQSAFTGMEAISMCRSVPEDFYTLILMDLNMPYMNGAETISEIRKMGIKAPVIAVTASDKNDSRLTKTREAFDATLFKPFNSTDFYLAISPYINHATTYSLEAIVKHVDIVSESSPASDPNICDVDKAIENMGGSQRLFTKHFQNFINNNVDLEMRMRTMLYSGNYRDCAVLSHSLKGLSGMLGMTTLHQHLSQLELLLNNHDPIQGDRRLIPKDISELLSAIGDDILLVCKVQF